MWLKDALTLGQAAWNGKEGLLQETATEGTALNYKGLSSFYDFSETEKIPSC